MTDTFNSDMFTDWGEQLVTVINETAKLVYNTEEVDALYNSGEFEDYRTRRDFSTLLLDLVINATKLKINKHTGEDTAIGYLLIVLVMLDRLKESVDPKPDQPDEVKIAVATAVARCDIEMVRLEALLLELVKGLNDDQIQHIHSVLVKDIERWSGKAIDLFTLAEIKSVGE